MQRKRQKSCYVLLPITERDVAVRKMTSIGILLVTAAFSSSPYVAHGIIAGNFAKEGDYPYSVVIIQDGDVICGGVLVTNQHVFTSCHCVGKFGLIEDVTEISWEPNETRYTINVTFDDSKWTTLTPNHGRDGKDDDYYYLDDDTRHRRQAYTTKASTFSTTRNATFITAFSTTRNATFITAFPTTRIATFTTSSRSTDNSTNNASITSHTETTPRITNFTIYYGNVSVTNATGVPNDRGYDDGTDTPTTKPPDTEFREGFIPFDLKQILLVAGTVWKDSIGKGQVRQPFSSFQHPSCSNNSSPWDFDYGVYQCNRFYLNHFLEPMALWYRDQEIMRKRFNDMVNDGAKCTTVGWGITQKTDGLGISMKNNSEKLKETQVKLLTDSLCNELLCRKPFKAKGLCKYVDFAWSDRGIVCAMHLSRGDSCDGDDGNALVCNDYVVGFANSGVDCFAAVPRFYTRLDYATDFYYSTVSSFSGRNTIGWVVTIILVTHIIKALKIYQTCLC